MIPVPLKRPTSYLIESALQPMDKLTNPRKISIRNNDYSTTNRLVIFLSIRIDWAVRDRNTIKTSQMPTALPGELLYALPRIPLTTTIPNSNDEAKRQALHWPFIATNNDATLPIISISSVFTATCLSP